MRSRYGLWIVGVTLLFCAHIPLYALELDDFLEHPRLHGEVSLDPESMKNKIGVSVGWKEIKKWLRHNFKIGRGMITHPCTTSAMTESSPWVADYMLEHLNEGTVLEIGSGPGWTLTDWIAHACHEGQVFSRLDIVECNKRFFKNVCKHYGNLRPDGPLRNVYLYDEAFGSAWRPRNMKKFVGQYDNIIATLPFTRLPNDVVQGILQRALQLLKPGGKFVYIYLLGSRTRSKVEAAVKELWDHNAQVPPTRECMEKLALLDDWLENNFTYTVKLVKRNLPPLWVGIATKN